MKETPNTVTNRNTTVTEKQIDFDMLESISRDLKSSYISPRPTHQSINIDTLKSIRNSI